MLKVGKLECPQRYGDDFVGSGGAHIRDPFGSENSLDQPKLLPRTEDRL
jgi:hypothetical protein